MARSRATFSAAVIIAMAAALFQPAKIFSQQEDPFSLGVVHIAEDQEFLYRLEQQKKTLAKNPGFLNDLPEKVPPDHWAYRAVMYLVEAGVINGDAASKFNGNRAVSKTELSSVVKALVDNYGRLVDEGIIVPPEEEAFSLENTFLPPVSAPNSELARMQPPVSVIKPEAERARPPATIITPDPVDRIQPPAVTITPPIPQDSIDEMPSVVSLVPEQTPMPSMADILPYTKQREYGPLDHPAVEPEKPLNAFNPLELPVLVPAIIPAPSRGRETPPPPEDPVVKPDIPESSFNPLDLPVMPDAVIPSMLPAPAYIPPASLNRGSLKSMGKSEKTEQPAETVAETPGETAEKKEEAEEKSSKSSKSSKSKKDDGKEEKDDKKSSKSSKDKKDKKKDIKVPKEFSKLEKTLEKEDLELTQKDVEILEAIVTYVEKDVVKGQVNKDISEVKRIASTNERDIQRLEEQNQRLKITGSGSVSYERTTKEFKFKDIGDSGEFVGEPSGTPSKSLSANFYSKPRRFDDMTMRWSGSLTDSGSLRLSYQDFSVDKTSPRNFKLRSLYAGRTAFGSSPLTTLGRGINGFYTELKLNDYSVKGAIGTHDGNSNIFINAASLQFNLFGEPRSWAYITRVSSYDKRNSTYHPERDKSDRRRWGWWGSGKGSLFLPPEKNSVTSFYVRYPLPVQGLYVTAEYAHSTYYRPGFKLAFPKDDSDFNKFDAECADGDCGSWDEYWWDNSKNFTPKHELSTWMGIPELRNQDDSFFVLFDYNKGPLQIFPLGYIRLGNKFVSKYMGLPGFSVDDFGIDVLPISLQSLEVIALRGNIKKLEDNYKWDFVFVTGGETKPMFFDTSAMPGDQPIVFSTNFIARLNNRPQNARLKLSYVQNKFTYYMSDDITLSGDFSTVKAKFPSTCIDGNVNNTKITDDYGNVVGVQVGNGVADCDQTSPTFDGQDISLDLLFTMKSQKYNLFWRTSKKAEVSVDYGIDDTRLQGKSSVGLVNDLLNNMVPQGQKYYMKYNLKYRLTDVSKVEFWFNKDFPRIDNSLVNPDTVFQHKVGMRLNMSY